MKSVSLRELTAIDLKTIREWRHDPETVKHLAAPLRFINEETELAWFETYQRNRGSQVRCSIFVEGNPSPVGLISLTGIDAVHRGAELHILIGAAQDRGKRVGTAALSAMLRHAFRDLNLHRVEVKVLEENTVALRLYERAGFRREGVAREAVFKGGVYRSLVSMGILSDEFERA